MKSIHQKNHSSDTGYKQTEVGVIPEDWDLDYIENLAHITTGGRNTQDRVNDGQYPFFVRSQTVERINSYSFDGEAVLTAGDGVGTGKVFHYIKGKFDAHQRVYRISDFNERINGYFFYLYFSSHFYNRIMQMTAKSSVDSVRRDMIARMLIPFPSSKAEQEAIAEALSDADALIESLEQLIAKKRQIKQGAMQELLRPKEGWVEQPLGEIASVNKGSQLHSSEISPTGQFAHLNGGITPSGYAEKFNTPADTIAISEGGNSCGYVQFMAEAFWCGGHCYSIVPSKVDKLFLYHALKAQQLTIMGLRVGSGLPNVQKSALLDFKLQYPPAKAEQTAIAAILSDMDAEIGALEAKLAKARQLKQGMMHNLLTGRIRLI